MIVLIELTQDYLAVTTSIQCEFCQSQDPLSELLNEHCEVQSLEIGRKDLY